VRLSARSLSLPASASSSPVGSARTGAPSFWSSRSTRATSPSGDRSAEGSGKAARGALALWHYGPYCRLTCACSRERKCVRKSRLEQARSATGSTAKLLLSCGRSTSQRKPRPGVRSRGLLQELAVVHGRFAPDAGIIVGREGQPRGCSGGPRGRPAPEAPRWPGTGWRSR
jgi:hypothetical protein